MNRFLRLIKAGMKLYVFRQRMPLFIQMLLTNRCNALCKYCKIPLREKKELTTERIFVLIDEMVRMGTERLGLFGGEPLLRKDIYEIISYAKRKGLMVHLYTNGLLVRENIEAIKLLDGVFISIDGTKEIHDHFRGKGNYEKVIEAIEVCRPHVPVFLMTVLTKQNKECIDYMSELSRKYDCLVSFQFVYETKSMSADVKPYELSYEETQACIKKLLDLKKHNSNIALSKSNLQRLLKRKPGTHKKAHQFGIVKCWNGTAACVIDSDGTLYSCYQLIGKESALNLNDASLEQAFNHIHSCSCPTCDVSCSAEYNLWLNLDPDAIMNLVQMLIRSSRQKLLKKKLQSVMNTAKHVFKKLQHFAYHTKVIKKRWPLVKKIASGYAKTLIAKQNVLRTVEFALLADCNSKCVMCYSSKLKRPNENYMSVEAYREIWKQAQRLGAFSVILSGGEPTLRKDLFEIISVLDPKNSIIALVTNSLRLNESFLKSLKEAGVHALHFSLDSTDQKTNDEIRGAAGHYSQVMQSIQTAKTLGFAVYLSTVIMHNGLEKMKEMTEFAKSNGIGIVFSLACVSGNWAQEKDVLLTREEWIAVQDFMKQNPFVRSDWTINFSMRQECPGGREKVNISCYGDVTGCGMNPVSFGNVREEGLEKIWRRMANFPDFKRRSQDCLIGTDQQYIESYIRPLSNFTNVPIRIDQHPTLPIPLETLEANGTQKDKVQ